MAIETAFAAWIGAKTPVIAIIGDALHCEEAPAKAPRPFLVYRLSDGERLYHSEGSSGLVRAEIELTCAGRKYLESVALYEAIRNDLDGFQGAWGSYEIDRAVISPARSGRETPAEAAAIGLHALKATIELHYHEPLPVRS